MRRSYQETKELVAARCQDFVEGASSEAVLRASLKSLGLLSDEIEEACMDAARAFIAARRTHAADPEVQRMKDSVAHIEKYLKEKT